jgi:hypothetical protein
MNKPVKYHDSAKYVDCALDSKDYCRVCGWTKPRKQRKTINKIGRQVLLSS